MKLNQLFSILITGTFFVSCSSSLEFSQKKYLDGYRGDKSTLKHIGSDEIKNVKHQTTVKEQMVLDSYSESLQASLDDKVILTNSVNSAEIITNEIDNSHLSKEIFVKTAEKPLKLNVNKEVQKEKNTKAVSALKRANIIEVVLAFFIPPLAVFLHNGLDTSFWISLILTCFFWVPGVVFSLLVVLDMI